MLVPRALRDMSIAIKLFAIIGLLALTAVLVGSSGLYALHVYRAKVIEMRQASERAIVGEQLNGLINAVVMDSRGIYMAKDAAEVEKYGTPLLANLKRVEERAARWSSLVQPDAAALLNECLRQLSGFISLRTAVVEVARAHGAAAAAAIGDNDANRANRQALNQVVVALARRNRDDVVRLDDEMARFEQTMVTVLPLATGTSILIVAVLAGFLIIGGIARPLSRITGVMNDIANGDLDVELASSGRADEIGRIGLALQVFRNQAIENRRLTVAQEQQRRVAEEQKRDALLAMAAAIEAAANLAMMEIGRQSGALQTTASEMRDRAERTGASARGAAAACAIASASARIVAGSAEQLTASIHEISTRVQESAEIIAHAVHAGNEARTTIDALNERVGRIGSVADMIKGIAAQTNLLALNATIEAARAGAAGKGFAVVASEVKQLAKMTAHSTGEIARHIQEINASTAAAVGAVARIEARIHDITTISGAIAAAIIQQGSATTEIARNVVQTASATNEITERNAEVSKEAALGGPQAEAVLVSTRGLSAAVDGLKIAVAHAVRGSSEDLNRPAAHRLTLDLPCRVEMADRTTNRARLTDLSERGARIHGTSSCPPGSHGRLFIEHVDAPIEFVVTDATPDQARLSFKSDQTSALRHLLEPAAQQAA